MHEQRMNGMTIGQAAEAAGVHIETMRYYERRGLLHRPPRSGANYRLYSAESVKQVRFVKRAQELGFSLKEIKELLALRVGSNPASVVRERAQRKIEDIDEKIESLQAMKRALQPLLRSCRGSGACPILNSLEAMEVIE